MPAPSARQAALRFTATGATLRLDAPEHLLLLAPFKSVVVLRAYRGQQLVGQRTFHAVLPPLPAIATFTSGPFSSTDYKPSPDQHFTLTVRAIPAAPFAAFFPLDARYRVARFRTTLRRAGQVVGTPALWQREARLADLTPGDELQVDMLQVQRQNFQAAVQEVPVQKQVVIPYDRW
ncbi:hypothetical protein GO988_23400 [Hymenobacter sp. HMF4947]|uniref:Gliding motility-associated protein GldM C-terminal domain-containing protein n=1 Tax=Hymenobacter ginkgonis TaxID=2682976 RepID=A0A7K1TLL3_9BACT|nr:GldM family protein [Hymenobacter ginkgonis]MVN79290.1 hypothetical protein [Hymenobacter ginkgonis]